MQSCSNDKHSQSNCASGGPNVLWPTLGRFHHNGVIADTLVLLSYWRCYWCRDAAKCLTALKHQDAVDSLLGSSFCWKAKLPCADSNGEDWQAPCSPCAWRSPHGYSPDTNARVCSGCWLCRIMFSSCQFHANFLGCFPRFLKLVLQIWEFIRSQVVYSSMLRIRAN